MHDRIRDAGDFLLGLALTALAGWVDGVGFLEFGGFYLSFMSGNTIQIGVGAAAGDAGHAIQAGGAIGCFVLGAFAGGLLTASARAWARPVGLFILAGGLALAYYLVTRTGAAAIAAVTPVAFCMGLQNHVVSKGRLDSAGTTFVTGALFRLGDACARVLARTESIAQPLRILTVVTCFSLGAFGGAVCSIRYGVVTLTAPAGAALGFGVISLLVETVRAFRRRARPAAVMDASA